jgi:outer membrane biosynthesis protein TonB
MHHGRHDRGNALVVVVLVFAVLLPVFPAFSGAVSGTITGDGVTTRTGPGVEYEKVGRLHTGAHVTVLEEAEKWLKVIDPDGEEVWVFARWVEMAPQESEPEKMPPSDSEPEREEAPLPEGEPETAKTPDVEDQGEQESAPLQAETKQPVSEPETTTMVQETPAVEPPPLIEDEGGGVPWVWIGAGATAAGVLGYFLLSAEEETSDTGSLHIHVEFP